MFSVIKNIYSKYLEKAKENSVTTCKTNYPASKERELVNSETNICIPVSFNTNISHQLLT